MFRQVSAYLLHLSGFKTWLIATLVLAVFSGYIMPRGAAVTSALAGHQVAVFDLQFSYTPQQARNILSYYNEDARKFSAAFSYLADTVYPVAYTLFYIISLAWVYKNIHHGPAIYTHLHLFPVITAGADLVENAFVGAMMHSYPEISDTTIYLASFFTSAKWCLVGMQSLLLLGGIVQLLVQRLLTR